MATKDDSFMPEYWPGDLVKTKEHEKAKVVKVDEPHDEVTVELLEVAVPIPITVKSKMVKIFQKASQMEE